MAASNSCEWQQRAEELQQKWERLVSEARDDAVLSKASDTLQSLKQLCTEKTEPFNILSILHLYSKAVLDITFFEENQLVNEDFPEDSSQQKVKDLIQMLSEPELLAKEANMGKEPPVVVLEDEVLECLYWRRGALLYMYSHTVREREGWLCRHASTFKQCLNDGVLFLLKMLKTRSPVNLNDVTFRDLSTATLLNQGIFSDVHVLALMYCGEMCYWMLKYCSDKEQSTDDGPHKECCNTSQFNLQDFKGTGEKALETYIYVCEGPLSGHGWSTENAKNILQLLNKR
ncbi:RAB7A-interacting MON1-CCZ1 complex subunit 1 [Bombina bombina]|uniref:RAB7A-interacting MON1-CCZ1 complex subunit 1 n=1 Tax=Bombina bombina TaxID=8345 RepID=UPI00235AF521|nr:RAB7A-interacting MON1-CCZ1 complex subunit 1 [Bombina bombina]